VGKQFKRNTPASMRSVWCAGVDLIQCEAVIEFEASRRLPIQGLLAYRPRWGALVTAPTLRLVRIIRPVLGDACWAAFMAHANAWLQCAVSGESPARPVYRDVATGMCGVWTLTERGAGRDSES
jgi:hypothetical protein